MSYKEFYSYVKKEHVKVMLELGSRDLDEAIDLLKYFDNSIIYSFECNPECLVECDKRLAILNDDFKKRLLLIRKAVSITDGNINFYPFDPTKDTNLGASSLLKIDYSLLAPWENEYNRPNPQCQIIVEGIRLDTFMDKSKITDIDLICIDLQGYELNALKSLGKYLHNVKYIITECNIQSLYTEGASFKDLDEYLKTFNFKYVVSNKFGTNYPDLSLRGYSEFDAVFVNTRFNDL